MQSHNAAGEKALEQVKTCLEAIVDPCSVTSSAPAGLISMGLVRKIDLGQQEDGVHVHVTLCITEPGCMMGALFRMTAERDLAELPGISNVVVDMDYDHVWSPEDMTPEYQQRLAQVRRRLRPITRLPS